MRSTSSAFLMKVPKSTALATMWPLSRHRLLLRLCLCLHLRHHHHQPRLPCLQYPVAEIETLPAASRP